MIKDLKSILTISVNAWIHLYLMMHVEAGGELKVVVWSCFAIYPERYSGEVCLDAKLKAPLDLVSNALDEGGCSHWTFRPVRWCNILAALDAGWPGDLTLNCISLKPAERPPKFSMTPTSEIFNFSCSWPFWPAVGTLRKHCTVDSERLAVGRLILALTVTLLETPG